MQGNYALYNTKQKGQAMTIQQTIDLLTGQNINKVLHTMTIPQLQAMLKTLPKGQRQAIARARTKSIVKARVKVIKA